MGHEWKHLEPNMHVLYELRVTSELQQCAVNKNKLGMCENRLRGCEQNTRRR